MTEGTNYDDIVKDLFEDMKKQKELEVGYYKDLLSKLHKIEKRPRIVRSTANQLFKLECVWKFLNNKLDPDEYKANITLLNAYNQYLKKGKIVRLKKRK